MSKPTTIRITRQVSHAAAVSAVVAVRGKQVSVVRGSGTTVEKKSRQARQARKVKSRISKLPARTFLRGIGNTLNIKGGNCEPRDIIASDPLEDSENLAGDFFMISEDISQSVRQFSAWGYNR